MQYQRLSHLCLLLCVCGLLSGCGGDGPKLVSGGGVVTYKGKPIGKINVLLTPTGKGMMAEGTTDESGKFKLQTKEPGDGVMVGSYAVTFTYVPDVPPDMFATTKPFSPIPEKYADSSKSGHTATVDADSSKNNFTFDLE